MYYIIICTLFEKLRYSPAETFSGPHNQIPQLGMFYQLLNFCISDSMFVLVAYKTEPCKRAARLCRQGYACPNYHNNKDRRRSPKIFKYRYCTTLYQINIFNGTSGLYLRPQGGSFGSWNHVELLSERCWRSYQKACRRLIWYFKCAIPR